MGDQLEGIVSGRALRAAIIGTGFIGEVHARSVRRCGGVVAAAVASSPATTAAAVGRLGAERGAVDGFEVVASDDIDVVHICTPNHLHVPLALAALKAGKHVVCEKPLAVDSAVAAELAGTAASSGRIATVPFVYRFYPMVREARARVQDGFGPLRLAYGGYLQDWLSTESDDNWRVDEATSGPSRAFADIGSHWCDLFEFVSGDRLAAVCADLVTAIPERVAAPDTHAFASASSNGSTKQVTTEDAALVMFRTVAGASGSLVVSQLSSGHKNQLRFEIVGRECSIGFDQEHPDDLWIGRRSGTQLVPRDPGGLAPAAARYVVVPAGHPQGYQDCFDAFVADTYRAIAGAEVDGLPTFADGARAATITDAVLRSSAAGGWIDVAAADDRSIEPTRQGTLT